MMIFRLGFVILLFPFCLRVNAQDNATYHLHTPSATEYIEGITQIAKRDFSDEWSRRNFVYSLSGSVFRRFPDLAEVDFHRLIAAYDAMGIGSADYYPERGRWVEAILAAWLKQRHPDLTSISELYLDNFHIHVLPFDFDADGEDEYILDVIKAGVINRLDCRYWAEYVNYLVVRSTDDGYQLIETPLRWEGTRGNGGPGYGDGGQITLKFEDINADGLPEWLLLSGGVTGGGPGMGYENAGQLNILSWREGRLTDLAAIGDGKTYPYAVTLYGEDSYGCDNAVPRDVTWEFANLDDDEAQEILQHQIYLDNWRCIARETQIIDWDAAQDRYVQADTRHDFPEDTQNCARRQAEEAMWEGHYQEALEYYERALTLSPYLDPAENDPNIPDFYREDLHNRRITYDQYHMARMALAYQLTGQPEKARPILESLSQQEFSFEPVQYFADALLAAQPTPLGACTAAYTSFTQHFNFYRGSLDAYYLGVTVEMNYGAFEDYSPARVGCDAPQMIQDALNAEELRPNRLPTDYLDDLGVKVRKVIQADLNGDGIDEWLVWPEILIDPFFFALDDSGQYQVSTAPIDTFNHADEIVLWPLPDEAGTAVAYLLHDPERTYPEPWACVYDNICGLGGAMVQCVPDDPWGLSMWRMDGLALIQILDNIEVCRANIPALFPGGAGSVHLDGGEHIFEEANITRQIRYDWDGQTFAEAAAETPPPPTPTSITEPRYRDYGEAMNAGDYAAALTIIDEITDWDQDYYRDNPDQWYARLYTRAFILEALKRPDEALAEYVTIYEAAPDSAWGMLAALHLEK